MEDGEKIGGGGGFLDSDKGVKMSTPAMYGSRQSCAREFVLRRTARSDPQLQSAGARYPMPSATPIFFIDLSLPVTLWLRHLRGRTSAKGVSEIHLQPLNQLPCATENHANLLSTGFAFKTQILVDHACIYGATKRGADRRVELDV